jgi:hypothetical protein
MLQTLRPTLLQGVLRPVREGLWEDVSDLGPGKAEIAKFNKEFVLFGSKSAPLVPQRRRIACELLPY